MTSHLTAAQTLALGAVSTLYRAPQFTEQSGQPEKLRFGLIADPQYANADPNFEYNRYYRNSLRKLSQAITQLNDLPLAFVATLGDLVDRDWDSYADLLPVYQQLRHPHAVVMGNHDADVISCHLAAHSPALALPKHYYQFSLKGYRFIVIDGNDLSLYCNQANGDEYAQAQHLLARIRAEHQPQAQSWNGAVGDEQLRWLECSLADAQKQGEKVLVFGHYPLAPDNEHNLWNCDALVTLLCRYQVRAYFAGHYHLGDYVRMGNTDFITLKGMVDGDELLPFAVVELDGDSLSITGFGPEISRTLVR
ncbi:metallophosphoesterase [Serratia liquefaciens]|uniref:metallophosphoesterase n=1 Tax=Serratia liquefaciens TaxID=614 RepID=UPI0022DDD252|nr:metallophosphoesterase [Serratia liquefaciens]WBL72877.1 metallophosphoesterase [Serratia liquefaciens]